jgi:hypothetical protein
LIHTGLPRSFATTLTKRLASSANIDSIDLLPNPKPLNKLNVNREGIQKYIDEHNATLNEDDVRDFIDAYLLDIKHHKHGKYTLFMGK